MPIGGATSNGQNAVFKVEVASNNLRKRRKPSPMSGSTSEAIAGPQHAPKITFGMIVLNGEPFIGYNLRALYPHAYEIIVVEGAAPAAIGVSTPEGHSRDQTLETVRRFIAEEDSEKKVTLVTAEDEGYPDGFWPGEKDEQSQAYAKRATGDYLWQVDCDEFYRPDHISKMREQLKADPTISGAAFHQITFWGDTETVVDGWYLKRGAASYHRLFKWGKGYRYTTHRPPTVVNEQGHDMRDGHWLDSKDTREMGVVLYHYSLLFPKQVIEKCDYYGRAAWAQRPKALEWAHETFFELKKPFRVHNVYDYPSWLERFQGAHPPQVQRMMEDAVDGTLDIELRPMADVKALLRSPSFLIARQAIQWADYPEQRLRAAKPILTAIRSRLLRLRAIARRVLRL